MYLHINTTGQLEAECSLYFTRGTSAFKYVLYCTFIVYLYAIHSIFL